MARPSGSRELVPTPHPGSKQVTIANGVTSGPARRPWTPESLIAEADRGRLPVYVTREEAHRTFDAVPPDKPRDRLFVKTLWVTGARVSEAIEVRPRDFDFAARTLRIQRLKKGRPLEVAIPGLPEDYCRELATYLKLTGLRPGERVFDFDRFRGLRLVKGLMAQAGIEPSYRVGPKGGRVDVKRHPHAWRHGFAVNLIMQGKPLEVVKELLGHASILTTHIYSRAIAANTRPFMETTVF